MPWSILLAAIEQGRAHANRLPLRPAANDASGGRWSRLIGAACHAQQFRKRLPESSRTARKFSSRSNSRVAAHRKRLLPGAEAGTASSSCSFWMTTLAPFVRSFGATACNISARRLMSFPCRNASTAPATSATHTARAKPGSPGRTRPAAVRLERCAVSFANHERNPTIPAKFFRQQPIAEPPGQNFGIGAGGADVGDQVGDGEARRTAGLKRAINKSAISLRPSRRNPISAASSSITLLPIGRVFTANFLKAKCIAPAGAGSLPGAVSSTASRKPASPSLRPISCTADCAHLSAWRWRQQPAQAGPTRTRSSNDFRAMPAAKAASPSLKSRARSPRPAGAARPPARRGWRTGSEAANPCRRA